MSLQTKILKEIEKRPCRLKELKKRLGNDKKVQRTVEELVWRGMLREKDGAYFLTRTGDADKAFPCRLVKLGRRFGFASRLDGEGDIFIPGRSLLGAMPGDQVLVRLFDHPRVAGSQEGEVVSILEPHNTFVGEIVEAEGRLALKPDVSPDNLLYIKKSADGGARPGEKAAVEILERGDHHAGHRAGVAMRFGSAEQAGHCIEALLYAAGLNRRFPEKVKAEARALENATVQPAQIRGRLDLRDTPIFTIDSASTKDIDDAVSIERTAAGYRLGVHIADVSEYVKPGTALDDEAFQRGTSVYFGESVLPMLPRQLSNGICSLNPQEERLAFSCMMELDARGEIVRYAFAKTVIRSRVKGVYDEINALLAGQGNAELADKYAQVALQLPVLDELYRLRAARRKERGGLEIESDEAKIVLDANGRCVDVVCRKRGRSEMIIEECMLLANQCAAKAARKAKAPFVYRVHEKPDAERLERLQTLLTACNVNVKFPPEGPAPRDFAQLLDATRGQPLERAIHTGVLRCMSKACYETAPKGHFGLALEDYAHFTSPIRRYPDLAIHRILSDLIAGASENTLKERYQDFAQAAADQSSAREVLAMQTERSATSCYKAEYMQARLGQEFEGVVSGVAAHGVYVELPNTVEGMLRTVEICQGEPVLTDGVRVSDPISGKSWALGDTVRVKVTRVDIALGNVDFALADAAE